MKGLKDYRCPGCGVLLFRFNELRGIVEVRCRRCKRLVTYVSYPEI